MSNSFTPPNPNHHPRPQVCHPPPPEPPVLPPIPPGVQTQCCTEPVSLELIIQALGSFCGSAAAAVLSHVAASVWIGYIEISVYDAFAGPFGECVVYGYDVQIVCDDTPIWLCQLRARGTTTWHPATTVDQTCDPLRYDGSWIVNDPTHPGVADTITFQIDDPS
jgi:hypothetical protein